jgi:hypothetical protein
MNFMVMSRNLNILYEKVLPEGFDLAKQYKKRARRKKEKSLQ